MAKIYISSTYSDLTEYRAEAYRALRKLGHNVIAMEDYGASSRRPLDKCLADVSSCDIYIGIFAWRYGAVPPEKDKSFTEFEFREAAAREKACLIFLLHEDAPWRKSFIDKETGKIEALREELKRTFTVGFFSNKDELAREITIAVSSVPIPDNENGAPKISEFKSRENEDDVKNILKILKPIIVVFLAILALSIISMILCLIIGVNGELALYGLGGISAFLIFSLTFIFNKFVQVAQSAN